MTALRVGELWEFRGHNTQLDAEVGAVFSRISTVPG